MRRLMIHDPMFAGLSTKSKGELKRLCWDFGLVIRDEDSRRGLITKLMQEIRKRRDPTPPPRDTYLVRSIGCVLCSLQCAEDHSPTARGIELCTSDYARRELGLRESTTLECVCGKVIGREMTVGTV